MASLAALLGCIGTVLVTEGSARGRHTARDDCLVGLRLAESHNSSEFFFAARDRDRSKLYDMTGVITEVLIVLASRDAQVDSITANGRHSVSVHAGHVAV